MTEPEPKSGVSGTRRCNECTLCCKVMPVREIAKKAGIACTHQRSKGCRVYGTPSFPPACHLWSCLWLLNDSLPLPRPDRSRYVIDPAPEFILINGHAFRVLQIWVDPRVPNAHRDPALRTWLAARWDTHEELGLVRFDSRRAIVLVPPILTDGEWLEAPGSQTVAEHTPAEISATLRRLKRNGPT